MTDDITRLKGTLEDRYRVEREIGAGGMATVYLAEDLKHERRVAIKVLKPEVASAVGAERFLAEIKTTANLHHPHILPLHDSGEADGLLFFVTPYVEGESLARRLDREHQLPVDEAVGIATDIAAALDYAHERGVIHRDVKPGNILMHSGRPLVADFGIALAVTTASSHRMTETGLTVGTPCYMSPEQATGDQNVGAQADTYSLGCVLYEMLVGEPPFMGTTTQAILGKIVTGETPSTMAQRKAVPPNVDSAIAKALEKVPADRFKTTGAFAEALADPAFRHGAGAAMAGSAPGRWRQVGLVATLLLVVMSAVASLGWLRSPPPAPVSRYVLGQSDQEKMVATFGPSVAVSPDGQRLAYVGEGETEVLGLWVKERDEAHARRIPGTDAANQPFFFPDGDRIGFLTRPYYGGQERAVRVVSLETGSVVTLADSGFLRNGAAADVDGNIYLTSSERLLVRLPASGGALEPVTALLPGERAHIFPALLPGGRGLLFTVLYAPFDLIGAAIAVVDLSTGERRVLVQGAAVSLYAESGHLLYVRSDGSLTAAPFDETKLRLTGDAVRILGDIHGGTGAEHPEFGVDIAMSRTGTFVYRMSAPVDETSRSLEWVTRNGSAQSLDPGWQADFEGVSLSHDGTRLAATLGANDETDVWIRELDQGSPTPLTFTEGLNRRPVWMPDGVTISYIRDQSGNRDVFAKRADGLGSAEAVFDIDAHVDEAVWSNDGQWLVYRTGIDAGNRDIFAWRVGSPIESAIEISALPGVDEYGPTLSPDGGHVAYVSHERGGQAQVWVRTFPDVNGGRWQVSTEGGTEPLWSPTGRELFYVGPEGLVAVAVETRPVFKHGEKTLLFSLAPYSRFALNRAYDVTSDGQRFVMIREPNADLRPDLIVVENFFEELRERMGG